MLSIKCFVKLTHCTRTQRYFADESPAKSPDAVESPAPPPKAKKGFFRRLRNFFYTSIFLSGALFSGGVYYSRINDDFHDVFTQYVPYGEQAIMYLEELEFQKQLPSHSNVPKPSRDTGSKVTIPPQSGASWRVADGGNSTSRSSALTKEKQKVSESKASTPKVEPKLQSEKPVSVEKKAREDLPPAPMPVPFKAPEVNEPSRMPPAAPIDPLSVNDATEPAVQELVRMLNDLILIANADNADGRFSSSFEKAKGHISKVGQQIKEIKMAAEEEAEQKVRMYVDIIEKKSQDLESATAAAMLDLEIRHQTEVAQEMDELKAKFEERLNLMTERERKLNEERQANVLREQAIELTRQFTKDIRNQVEEERNARLGRLEKLSTAVHDLEKLTVGWSEVVDTDIQTQQLHVAVEAVRASLESANQPKPFVRELVALKEIASNNPAVDAAIGSINPTAYQKGISSLPQLIDRFRRVAAEVRKASLLPEGAGVASHASSLVLSHLMFKKQGLVGGDDVESILTRTQTLLEEGSLDAAAREMNSLDGWAKTLSRDWLDEVRRVLEVQQALDVSPIATTNIMKFNTNFYHRLYRQKHGCRASSSNKGFSNNWADLTCFPRFAAYIGNLEGGEV